MKILNFGSCNLDYVYRVDHIVVPGETIAGFGLETFPGGKGLNQSVAVAKAGSAVHHAGCIGRDGEMLKQFLEAGGVDVTYLRTLDAKTGHAVIQLDAKGENSILLFRGCNELVSEAWIDEVLDNFCAGDILLLQNEISNVEYLIDRAFARGMRIVFNPAPFTENLKQIDFGKLAYLILNEIEAAHCGGRETPEENLAELRARYPDLKLVLTVGKKGSLYSEGGRVLRQPAYSVKAVDTTAAGDTFIGYFISAIASARSAEEALRLASCAAALAVSRKGAATSIPLRGEVESALETLSAGGQGESREEIIRRELDSYLANSLPVATLGKLAARLHYSEGYTGQVIKSLTGSTFSELLQDKRCTLAARLLAETDLPVQEIIQRVGYNNESFFRRAFRRKYGETPKQYRKSRREI